MENIKIIFYILIFFLVLLPPLKAQDFTELVQNAWENNSLLKSKGFQLQSATYNLQEAKAQFGPAVSFGTQYTLASVVEL
ncbi:MAG: TolC family protein [Saprospiraceae bacterium]|nr:TolC family protein [Saprospiraceae bacterium]